MEFNNVTIAIIGILVLALIFLLFGGRLGWHKFSFKLPGGGEAKIERAQPEGPERASGSNPSDAGSMPSPDRQHQLPRDLPDFTGREDEIKQLENVLRGARGWASIFSSNKRQNPVSTLQGMGGIGKSVLAFHVGRRVMDAYPDAQIVVDMRGIYDDALTPEQAMTQVIHAWHPEARIPDDAGQLRGIYNNVLADKHALIILDNARDAAQVQGLEPPNSCALIITSRRPIEMPGVQRIPLDELSENDSLNLLRHIVSNRIDTDADLKELARLCGYLPLGLRAAGTYLAANEAYSIETYLKELAVEGSRLQGLDRENWQVEATLALSAAQIARENAALAAKWQMLTVFAAPFMSPAATQVWDTTAEQAELDLSTLVNRTLLLHDRESGRYRLHDLMLPVARNAFGYGGLDANQEEDDKRIYQAEMRHSSHFRDVLVNANVLYLEGGVDVLQGLALADSEWPNILAGQERVQQRAENDDLAAEQCNAYGNTGGFIIDLRLYPRERIGWMEHARWSARRIGDRRSEGNHLGSLGWAHINLGEPLRAVEYCEQALAIMRDPEISHRVGEATVLGNMGIAYKDLLEFRRAIECYEQQLLIVRAPEILDRRNEGNALGNLGIAYKELGEPRRAIGYYEQQLAITREIGDRRGDGHAMGNLGNAYSALGETRRAIEYYEQQLNIVHEIGDRRGEGNALYNWALEQVKLGEIDEAIKMGAAALEIFEQIEDPNAETARQTLAEWRDLPSP